MKIIKPLTIQTAEGKKKKNSEQFCIFGLYSILCLISRNEFWLLVHNPWSSSNFKQKNSDTDR